MKKAMAFILAMLMSTSVLINGGTVTVLAQDEETLGGENSIQMEEIQGQEDSSSKEEKEEEEEKKEEFQEEDIGEEKEHETEKESKPEVQEGSQKAETESEVVSTLLDGAEKEDNVPLGTIGELFPENSWVQRFVIEAVGNSANADTVVTQADLDRVTYLMSGTAGYYVLKKRDLINMPLLRNVREIRLQGSGGDIEDMAYFWETMGKMENLEILSLTFDSVGHQGKANNYSLNVPYMPKLKELSIYNMAMAMNAKRNAGGAGYVFDASHLNKSNLPVIEKLVLSPIALANYDEIGTLDTLKLLSLPSGKYYLRDIEFVKNLVNLESLDIYMGAVTDFTPLYHLPNLKKVNAKDQQIYYIKEDAIDYYKQSGEAVLPARITLPDGSSVGAEHFIGFAPARAAFDAGSQTVKIENLEKSELQEKKIYEVAVDGNHHLAEYNVPLALAKFKIPSSLANGTAVEIGGTIAYEVNFKEGIPQYEVTYDSKGGTPIASEVVAVNEKLTEPEAPTREGYTFAGWYTEETYVKKWDFEQDVMPAGNLTLYAKWILNALELNHAPTIHAEDRALTVGETFEPLEGVTAFDEEDRDIALTQENIIANDVDMSKAGTYHVTYQVTDSQGATAKKTITVVVNPKMEELNQVPIIHAEDRVLTVGDAFDPLEGVTAFDEEDGDIALTQENIIANDVDMSYAGTYQVTYQVTDSKGASGIKTITVTVKEKEVQEPSKPQEPQKPDQPAEGARPNKPDSPAKPTKPSQTPQTGDTSAVGILGGMLAGSAGVLFALRRKRNRTRKNEK